MIRRRRATASALALAAMILAAALAALLGTGETRPAHASASGTTTTPASDSPTTTAPGPPSPALTLPTAGHLSVGVTHAQASADPWGNPAAVASAKKVLSAQPMYQAQSIMGWGVGNPEPSPGVYDWSGLDRRLALIRSTSGIPVITLCGAPDWMAGYPPGETDWSRLGEAPTSAHYQDFADLAAKVAQRYPDVHYFQVWNEMTGFWDAADEQWDAAGYTEMYNDVYRAVKAVDPSAQIGGPYVVMASSAEPATDQPSAPQPAAADQPAADQPATDQPASPSLEVGTVNGPWGTVDPRALAVVVYWLAHAVGAQFVAVDADSEPTYGAPVTDEFTATEKFAAVDDWLRQRTDLPIWWSEFYVQAAKTTWTPPHQAAVLTTAMARMAASGASVALLWGPQANGQGTLLGYLWTSTAHPGGGRPTPLAASILRFDASSGTPGEEVVINPTPDRQPAPGDGPPLAPYQVRYQVAR